MPLVTPFVCQGSLLNELAWTFTSFTVHLTSAAKERTQTLTHVQEEVQASYKGGPRLNPQIKPIRGPFVPVLQSLEDF